MIPLLRLADLRDLTDAELRRHIFAQYMRPSGDDECPDCEGWGVHELGGMRRYGPDEDTCSTCAGRGKRLGVEHPSDAELAQRIGTVLVAYESVGDWGCDSSAYFLIERDGGLYEVHGSHDSTCGFEGQWSPTLVTPGYLVSEHWRMSVGGYDEHCDPHPAWNCDTCNGAGYFVDGVTLEITSTCPTCDGSGRHVELCARCRGRGGYDDGVTDQWYRCDDCHGSGTVVAELSTRDVVKLWLHHRFGGELAEQPFVLPEWAIPTWARHVDKQGDLVDLRAVDDRYLLGVVRWACRKIRKHWHEEQYVYVVNTVPQQRVIVVGHHDAVALAQAVACQTVDLIAAVPSDGVVAVCTERGRRVDTLRVEHRAPHARGSFLNAMRETEARGLLPTWDELRIAGDVAELRGAMVHRPIAADEVTCVPIEGGPRDLVDLWVGYGVRDEA